MHGQMNQGTNFLGGSFTKTMYELQSNLEEDSSSLLKYNFSAKRDP